MLVLHATYEDGNIYYWGESPFESESTPSKSRAAVKPFPFAADGETVRNAIAEILYDGRIRKLETTPLALWLPTVGENPVPSGPLIQDGTPPSQNQKLKAWKVDSVCIGKENSISFLSACVNQDIIKSGTVIGDDLAFWVRAIRFAGAQIARQEYLPDLVDNKSDFRALWEPMFLGDDHKYIELMTSCMPGACRAGTLNIKAKKAPNLPAGHILRTFIVEVVDHLARHAIYSQPQTTWSVGALDENGEFNSIHDQWLKALVDETNAVEGKTKNLKILSQQIGLWRKPLSASSTTPFRLALKLKEPIGKSKKWAVQFYLQSNADHQVLIPAEHVWNPTPEETEFLTRDGFDAKEFLLSSLGLASRICPRIEESLMHDAPVGYDLQTDGSYEFLTGRAIALDQAGFGVLTPDWWTGRTTRKCLGARAHINTDSKSNQNLSLNHMLKYSWEVTLDGEEISKKELQELAKSKLPLIQMRGHWLHISKEDAETAMSLRESKKDETGSLKDVIQMALGAGRIPGNFEFAGVQTSGWISKFLGQLEGNDSFDELNPPDGFKGKLRSYQKRGFSWLHFLKQWGLGACLADDMGLGKTVQALAMIQHDREAGETHPVLIICPTSLTGNWFHETHRFTPDLNVLVHHGVNRAKGENFQKEAQKHAVVISSFSILHRDIEIIRQIPWAGVILDEAQNIKNPKTKQARSACSLKAGYRIAMTGTPIENNVGDLWSIMEFLNPGLLGSHADFKRNFLQPIQANHESRAVERLKKLTGPFVLRRLKSDKTIIKDLPKKMEMKVYTTLTKEQAALYEALVQDVENTLENTEGIQRRGLVLSTLTKLKQICNHPAHFLADGSSLSERSGKLSRLQEMLEEILAVDERVLIFTQFAEMGKLIQKHLQETFGEEVLFLYGGVPKHKRDEMIERFQNEEHGPHFFVLSLKAGGTGLNLMRANHVFHYDRWWNPAVEDQATDRVYRIGQTRNVQIHKFLCGGTLEERIDEMITQKKDLAASVVGSGENWLTELSTSELKKLFTLRSEAVSP